MMSTDMPQYVSEALEIAHTIDLTVESMGDGAWDCLLVPCDTADAVIVALGERFDYDDPNDLSTPWTRILVREA